VFIDSAATALLIIKEQKPMRKVSIIICIIVICMGAAWALEVEAASQIEFVGGTTFDFGDVQANETLTHIFVFRNIGDEVLKIENLESG
jgi:hypothetical protein